MKKRHKVGQTLIYYNYLIDCIFAVTRVNDTEYGFLTEYDAVDNGMRQKTSKPCSDVIGNFSEYPEPFVYLIGEL